MIKLGIWNNTGEFTSVVTSETEDNNTGGYLIIDKQLTQEEDSRQGLGVFLQFGANDSDVNEIDMYIGGGLNYRGLISGRDDDEAGIAVAHARINDDVVSAGGRDDFETTIEVTYSLQLNDIIRIQPDLQYIMNPGTAEGVENAFVVGVRVEISL
jgi:porin